MSIDLEYAIKKDIRNNPVVRETDTRHKSELRRMVVVGLLGFGMLLFSAWQLDEMTQTGRRIERLRISRAQEEVVNRQLRLNLETIRAPGELETRARRIGLHPAGPRETLILERVRDTSPAGTFVARSH
jgi:hypothetical protein